MITTTTTMATIITTTTTATQTTPKAQSSLFDLSPEELVDRALHRLQSSGVQLIEWGAELQRRLGVPVMLKVRLFSTYELLGLDTYARSCHRILHT